LFRPDEEEEGAEFSIEATFSTVRGVSDVVEGGGEAINLASMADRRLERDSGVREVILGGSARREEKVSV